MKQADMGYIQSVNTLTNSDMAVGLIDYCFATDAVFPAILHDYNKTVSFLYA